MLSMLVLTAIAALTLHFNGPLLHLVIILQQAHIALLVWRLCLYMLITTLWWSLRQKTRQRAPQQLPVLHRLACGFTVMMALNELSCLLAWRTTL
jgi:hypothetical protein